MSMVTAAAGLIGAMLPARWWPWIDRYCPATRSALASSVVTVVLGGILGAGGFIDFAQRQASAVNAMVLSSPRAAAAGDQLSSLALQGVSALSVFAFFLTPMGAFAAYLVLSGLARAVSDAFGDGLGDPIITAADRGARSLYRRIEARRVRRAREAREGPPVADRILAGADVGLAADLAIVSARAKAGWDQGTVVRAGERWFRVGTIEERTIHGRLRTVYPLSEVRDHAVMRRIVDYEIPDALVQQKRQPELPS